jgi:short-subunit dehydrogenase
MTRPVALVTGASMGIGSDMAREFARRGHDLVLVARDEQRLNQLAVELKSMGANSTVIALDLGKAGAAQKLYDTVRSQPLVVETLVNNAGFGLKGRFIKLPMEEQSEIVQLNIVTLTELCWLFGRDMAARGFGRILNVASVAAFQSGPEFSVYAATKAYVLILSESLDAELRSQGVNVTTLCPGVVNTHFHTRAKNNSKLLLATAMDSKPVAVAAVRALIDCKPVVIPGFVNFMAIQIVRFLPRRLVTAVSYILVGRSSL